LVLGLVAEEAVLVGAVDAPLRAGLALALLIAIVLGHATLLLTAPGGLIELSRLIWTVQLAPSIGRTHSVGVLVVEVVAVGAPLEGLAHFAPF